MTFRFSIAALLGATLLLGAGPARSAPGALDPTFGNDGSGRVVTEINGATSKGQAVALQDGKIVVAGTVSSGIGLARYDADGHLDTTFGLGGTATLIGGPLIEAWALVVEPGTGKLIVVGDTSDGSFLIFRFTPNGDPDTTFGPPPAPQGAVAISPPIPSLALGFGLARQEDGQLVIGGPFPNADNNVALCFFRVLADGSNFDTSFGNGGFVSTTMRGIGRTALLSQPEDGKLLAIAYRAPGDVSAPFIFGVLRLDALGTLDPLFGAGGIAVAPIPGPTPTSLARQADGKILVAGAGAGGTNSVFALARFTTDGQLDPTFGGGAVTSGVAGHHFMGEAVVAQPNGQILVAGHEFDTLSVLFFALTRFNPNGTVDTSFGTGGVVTTDFGVGGVGGRSGIHGALLQGDKVVAAGEGGPRSVPDFALARYDASAGSNPGGGGGGGGPGCVASPPTFASVGCEIDALIATASATDVGKLRQKLSKLLGRARDKHARAAAAATGSKKGPVRKGLRAAAAALKSFAKSVRSKKGSREILNADTRTALAAAADGIGAELGSLRAAL